MFLQDIAKATGEGNFLLYIQSIVTLLGASVTPKLKFYPFYRVSHTKTIEYLKTAVAERK